ncbi:hypothetical protein F5J12DRAFT_781977 [Pisolithus orientalis]|uniref:uncharacterized protein n=1 Tax=Pisolithus orientalis TaxID=936130 RepID=UPI0022254C8A|nr:uncharacterized protein F5J12DRAFT_781977 [Pisolithus orientalis]KAI6009435.1 hypothetical protein F5J12DRAFT_781977 [Pisolithus orientalis]
MRHETVLGLLKGLRLQDMGSGDCQRVSGYRIWGVEGWFSVPSFTGTTEGCQITIYEEWSECAQQFRGWFCVQMDRPRLIRLETQSYKEVSSILERTLGSASFCLELEVDFISMAEDEQQP